MIMRLRFVFILIGFLFFSSLNECRTATAKDSTSLKTIYVVKHGWHTGIIVQRSAIDTLLPELTERYPDAHYLDISWGDKKYFMAPDDNIWLGIRAAIIPTKSVIRVLPFPEQLKNHFAQDHIQPVQLSHNQFVSMVRYFQNELLETKDDEFVMAGESRHFYLGRRKYWGLRTCNTWIAKALKRGGFPIKPFFSLTSGSVIKKVKHKENQRYK